MANQNDSFIDEVTDDLRRDRLFTAFRRFGWIAIALILVLVAGSAWREYSSGQAEKSARAWGDAVLAAQDSPDRATALAAIDAKGSGGRKLLSEMLAAGAEAEAGQADKASERLLAAAEANPQDPLLHDLALLKAVMLAGPTMDAAKRDGILSQLSKPGAPYELLALEQKAVALIGAGRSEDATMLIRQIQQKDGLSEALRRRLAEMMITLGADPEDAQGPGPQTMPIAPSE
ncbi:tetratricopeptide repeat protein [Paracoccus sp. CPCC 101403]|uniref:Tetratricopeptide repeat protein n=1 Tax=Paracoccus broussonetiae TaxID=3075834 RepID=A0ABU3EIC9_9RHOB|nr:tetratricopeptide repeat protein [Paracoccus sp. CPCC 101403]MDT1063547.1 tetratricopeptide repeat protein [Paracoccus sp. CPCC 101403]